jgi:hypothetical protein
VQTELSVLLLISASVIITCIVISYGVSIVQTTLNTSDYPELQKIMAIQESVMNQTDVLLNQTGLFPTNATSTP